MLLSPIVAIGTLGIGLIPLKLNYTDISTKKLAGVWEYY